jgi:hypothetical protein
MTSTTPEGLAERLEAAAKTATPGPWFADDHPLEIVAPHVSLVVASIDPLAEDAEEAAFNAAFIALANPKNILALIQALRSSEEQRDRMRGALIEMLALYDTALMATEFTKPRTGQIVMNIEKLKVAIEAARQALSQHQERQDAAHEKGPAG